mmetsp:Transcript_14517/g.32362  ORF Transcript_14517/g.32362 Transcript_14517/m.32362 type:complete len:478 (-) Transcript_14517:123-1556(-)
MNWQGGDTSASTNNYSAIPTRTPPAPAYASTPIRLKCIALGSAGAGKTSILRRFFNNTFEYGRRSTLGADFYTKRMNNPVYGINSPDPVTTTAATAAADSASASAASLRSALSDSSDVRSGVGVGVGNSNIGIASGGMSGSSGTLDPSSIHRKGNPDNASQRSLASSSRKYSELTTSKGNPLDLQAIEWDRVLTEEPYINLQMWDTAGRERFVAETKSGISSTLGDSFFRHADAAILCYDATSSRSFTQLLRWYAELMERMKTTTQERFPVIVVANKIDIIKKADTKPIRRRIVNQRDVMKLGTFRGKDHRYEYTVSSSPPLPPSSELTNLKAQGSHRHRKQSSLSYGLTDTSWTEDFSYLNSVIKSEDVSFPDRDMVILWCRRNGLEHFEVSALDGSGVNDAISAMTKLALVTINERRKSERIKTGGTDAAFLQDYWKSRGYDNGTSGGNLDLTARYTPKQKTRFECCWRLFPWCR